MVELTSVVWFHALQRMHEERSPLEIDIAVFRDDNALGGTSRPECMSQRSPWILRVCTKVALPILADLKPRGSSRYRKVDYASIVRCRLDRVRGSVFAQCYGTAVCIKGKLLIVEAMVTERIRGPEIRGFAVRIEDLGVELTRRMDTTGKVSWRGRVCCDMNTLTQRYCR